MKMRRVVLLVALLFNVGFARAGDLLITSFPGNGAVTWTYPTNEVREYRVEWCSDLTEGLWCDLEGGLRGIAPTGGTMTASVPMFYRIKAFGPEPTNMVYIPAGWFDMGNCMDPDEGSADELPVHPVYISGFYMDQYEVSSNLWAEVRTWALGNNYGFGDTESSLGTNYPIHAVSWFDAVKWANARSQREGLAPCYYLDDGHTVVYKSGNYDLTAANVDWTADGYRLPTEGEWEKAARGGASGHRFPWANDTIHHGYANYEAHPSYEDYDVNPTDGLHPDYRSDWPCTSPVGAFTPNGYGLHDMAGNTFQWCWDWYHHSYYTNSPSTDPRGPSTPSVGTRVLRGSSAMTGAYNCRAAHRYGTSPGMSFELSFRLVRAAR